jgi:hypothetical protein
MISQLDMGMIRNIMIGYRVVSCRVVNTNRTTGIVFRSVYNRGSFGLHPPSLFRRSILGNQIC